MLEEEDGLEAGTAGFAFAGGGFGLLPALDGFFSIGKDGGCPKIQIINLTNVNLGRFYVPFLHVNSTAVILFPISFHDFVSFTENILK